MARVSLKPIIRFVLKHQHKCTTTNNLRFKRHYSVTLPDTTTTNNQIPSTRSYSSQQEIDQLGSWNTRINFDISEEQSIRRGTPIPILNSSQVGTYSDQGRRMYQEDRYTVIEPMPNLLLLAVWDGHGGPDCANFCSENIEKFLLRRLAKNVNKELPDNYDLEQALHLTIMDLNTAFSKHWKVRPKNNNNNKEEADQTNNNSTPGSTATLALIRGGYELVIGHVGDSVAILCRDKEPRRLTKDHDPSVPEESQRILEAGGQIITDNKATMRVNGRLNMSRSIGDLDLKPYGVISNPDISRLSIKHGKDKFLVLMTDGVSSSMSDNEIMNCILHCDDPQAAASRLVDQALMYSCEDNATVLILPLGSWGKPEEGKETNMFSLGRNMALSSRYK